MNKIVKQTTGQLINTIYWGLLLMIFQFLEMYFLSEQHLFSILTTFFYSFFPNFPLWLPKGEMFIIPDQKTTFLYLRSTNDKVKLPLRTIVCWFINTSRVQQLFCSSIFCQTIKMTFCIGIVTNKLNHNYLSTHNKPFGK